MAEKIKVGFSVAVDKGPWWKTAYEIEALGYLELHPGNIPLVGDKIVDKEDIYKVKARYFHKDDHTWSIILEKLNNF